jgi:hypothetical protein
LKKGFLLLAILLSFKALSADFMPAKLLENNNSPLGETSQSSRIEWWAYVSFIIDKNGIPTDIQFINISDKAKTKTYSREKVISYLNKLRYSPATYKDDSVLSRKNFLYNWDISFNGTQNDGISIGFRKKYNLIDNNIVSDRLDEAREQLIELETDNEKNMLEQSLAAWLKSVYFYKAGDWDSYGEEVEKAYFLRSYLPKKMAIKTIQNFTDYLIFKKRYSAANAIAHTFVNFPGVSNGKEAYQGFHELIMSDIEKHPQIASVYTLKENLSSLILLSKAEIKLNLKPNSIDTLQLRCLNGVRTIVPKEAVELIVGEDEIGCSLMVKGKADSKISIIEQGRLLIK